MQLSQHKNYPRQIQWSIILGLTLLLYWPVLVPWGIELWEDPNYSHGLLIPFIFLYLWFEKRTEIQKAPVQPYLPGIFFVCFALVLYIVGYVGAEFFSKRLSCIFLIYGMILYLEGKNVAQIMRLPVVMLFFSVPLPYILYNAVAFPLKLIASRIAVWLLALIGMPVFLEGNIISLAHTTLEVVDACSGIRSLMTLVTLAFLLACFQHTSILKRLFVMLMAAPIAVLANAFRVAATGILTSFDPKWGVGTLHEMTGWLVFAISFLALAGISHLLVRTKSEGEKIE